ncbi:MAG TPA: hypothetical protein VKT53_06590 [Candidatus Acidoferrum sp.]|nr:hypothetical protein [Candidatus Acidoferrum sp.]
MASEQQAREIKNRHSAELLKLPGVCGVGVQKASEDDFYIALHIESEDPRVADKLPKELEGLRVETVVSGPFKKLSGSATD